MALIKMDASEFLGPGQITLAPRRPDARYLSTPVATFYFAIRTMAKIE